jgi:hypothetical protein
MAYTKPLAGVCFATALFLCAPDNAAPIPPDQVPASRDGSLTLNGDNAAITVHSGDQVSVDGTGFIPNAIVSIVLYSAPSPLGAVVADESGDISATVTVTAAAGTHTLVALGNSTTDDSRLLANSVTVAPSEPTGLLPGTGVELGLLLAAAVAALIAGLALVRTAVVRPRTRSKLQ